MAVMATAHRINLSSCDDPELDNEDIQVKQQLPAPIDADLVTNDMVCDEAEAKTNAPSNVIIFDWDDTLCPTSIINECDDFKEFLNSGEWEEREKYAPMLKKKLEVFDADMRATLEQIDKRKFKIEIATNAEPAWYEYSSKLLQRVSEFIANNNIKIVFAREVYHNMPSWAQPALDDSAPLHEYDETSWPINAKMTAYKMIIDRQPDTIHTFFAIGDRYWDADALRFIDISRAPGKHKRRRYSLVVPYEAGMEEAEGLQKMISSIAEIINVLNTKVHKGAQFSWDGKELHHAEHKFIAPFGPLYEPTFLYEPRLSYIRTADFSPVDLVCPHSLTTEADNTTSDTQSEPPLECYEAEYDIFPDIRHTI